MVRDRLVTAAMPVTLPNGPTGNDFIQRLGAMGAIRLPSAAGIGEELCSHRGGSWIPSQRPSHYVHRRGD